MYTIQKLSTENSLAWKKLIKNWFESSFKDTHGSGLLMFDKKKIGNMLEIKKKKLHTALGISGPFLKSMRPLFTFAARIKYKK